VGIRGGGKLDLSGIHVVRVQRLGVGNMVDLHGGCGMALIEMLWRCMAEA